jgi:hypothetical protein
VDADIADHDAASDAVGMAFGSGASGRTTPETDNGDLMGRAAALKAVGGQPHLPVNKPLAHTPQSVFLAICLFL